MENNQVKLRWSTPDADAEIAYIARVSNPANQANESIAGLLQYCMSNGHVSPFEMVNVCLEINTTRDIGRQILRHRSFSFQEFSQRYQDAAVLPMAPLRECRLQDTKNRQNSIDCLPHEHEGLQRWWTEAQMQLHGASLQAYSQALKAGIAKEQARALLPEGLTASRMYMNGTMRSWIHYLGARLDPSTQKEHRELAGQALAIIRKLAPVTINAFFPVVAQ